MSVESVAVKAADAGQLRSTAHLIGNLVGPGIGLFLASVAVSLYPAARAARLEPTAAIRHT